MVIAADLGHNRAALGMLQLMLIVTKVLVAGMVSALTMMAAPRSAAAIPLGADDQVAITQAVTGVGLFADLRDWSRVGALLADEVTSDYVSVFGGAPATTSRELLVDQWRATFTGFEVTKHQITNVVVTPNPDGTATALSHVRASHWVDGRSWVLGGVYTHHLARGADGWQVTYMRIDRLYEEGARLLRP